MHIIADDLTGAADASVAFAGTAPVRLLLDLPLRRQAAPVGHVAIDVDCRDVAAETAATRMAAALDRLPAGAELFVKIDSLLRGRIADMLHELRQWACGRPLVLAPALPAMGRSTAGGRLQIAGEVHWQTPSLFEMVAGLEPAWVCDAADDADLDAIVATMSQTVENAIWVGTAGLAKAIARARGDSPGAGLDLALAADAMRCVAVFGSASPTSATQARVLAGELDAEHVVVPAAEAVVPSSDSYSRLRMARADRHLVVSVEQPDDHPAALDPAVARSVAGLVAAHAADAGVLVLTGGATARSVLGCLNIGELDVVGELEPGAVLLRAGARYVVTKAGSFGHARTLASAVRRLIPIDQSHGGRHR